MAKAEVCKTFIRRFESARRLQHLLFWAQRAAYFIVINDKGFHDFALQREFRLRLPEL